MRRRPPISTRTDTLFPYTTLFRSPTKGVDGLVARNREEPRRDGRIVPPRMALHVNRKQRLLHDILRVDPAAHDLASREAAHQASRPVKEFRIGTVVSTDRGAHQPGQFVFIPAVQACLPFGYVRGRYLVTRAAEILFRPDSRRSRIRVPARDRKSTRLNSSH